jgi:hypothetical protein
MPIIKEALTLNNLKFLTRPRVALALIRGKVPDTDEFRIAIDKARENIKEGFYLTEEHIETINQLTGASHEDIYSYIKDLKNNDIFYNHLKTNILRYGCYAGISTISAAPILYVIIRIIKARNVIETGVANGVSSCFILQALEDNGGGKLYSIDIPALITKPDGKCGWLIPGYLKHRWTLILGRTAKKLVPLLRSLDHKKIDFFISDSAHYYQNEIFEFTTAWEFMEKGIIGCDEINNCTALPDFAKNKGLGLHEFDCQSHTMGFIRKGV